MRPAYKTALLWVCILALFLALWRLADHAPGPSFDRVRADVQAGRVASLRLRADGDRARAEVQLRGGAAYTTQEVALAEAIEVAQASGVPYALGADRGPSPWALVLTWLPALLIAVTMFFFYRTLRKRSGPTLTELTRARIEAKPPPPPRELAGLAEARERLVAAVGAVKRGIPGPRKILLSGPPGSGKTALVQWLAAEARLSSVVVPGSDVSHLFTGLAAARIRRIFEVAGEHSPCLAVIEDIDVLAFRRPPPGPQQGADSLRNGELELGLIELCQHLDGVRELPPRVLFVGTTNRADRLDEALTRPGRLDLHLVLGADGGVEVIDKMPPLPKANGSERR